MKKTIVLSLGGSLIFPKEIDTVFLQKFKKVILKNTKKYKFVIVCGGGRLARMSIESLKSIGASFDLQSLSGIAATRNNARFMNYFFGFEPRAGIPLTIKDIKNHLGKYDFVFCGGLTYTKRQTSDSTAVEIAGALRADFVNLTNVAGLYTKDPKKYKDAKFVEKISWRDFYKLANKTKFKPGQHFVLDQSAAKIILDNKIKTYIVGKNMKNLNNFFDGKKFKGTRVGS